MRSDAVRCRPMRSDVVRCGPMRSDAVISRTAVLHDDFESNEKSAGNEHTLSSMNRHFAMSYTE